MIGLLRRIAVSNCHKLFKNLATHLLARGDQDVVDEWHAQLESEIERKAARQADCAPRPADAGPEQQPA